MIGDYLSVASILSGFGVTALMFRIQRETSVQKDYASDSWMPTADFLILLTIIISLIFVVLPLVFFTEPPKHVVLLAKASCSAASVFVAGYPLAILDHYNILPWFERKAPPARTAPLEGYLVAATIVGGVIIFALRLIVD